MEGAGIGDTSVAEGKVAENSSFEVVGKSNWPFEDTANVPFQVSRYVCGGQEQKFDIPDSCRWVDSADRTFAEAEGNKEHGLEGV